MESHDDGMELFDVKIQLNQLKDLQLERKKMEKAILQLEKAIHREQKKKIHTKIQRLQSSCGRIWGQRKKG